MSAIHLRNGRVGAGRTLGTTLGVGSTWCGKKLIGESEREGALDRFVVYGSPLLVTDNPEAGTCPTCCGRFDAAYAAAFPNGLEPIATFRRDDPADMERLKGALGADALARAFGPDGGGLAEIDANLKGGNHGEG